MGAVEYVMFVSLNVLSKVWKPSTAFAEEAKLPLK